ncbi:MAG: DUF4430 domain-containing protein [Clostridium sp.]|nr:DUF4430 domain-containing protein [Clostridium sp.]
MENKKKKTLYNALMVLFIVVIAFCGAMIVAVTKGYVGHKENSIDVNEVYGVVSIEKNDIIYTLDEKSKITEGNVITTRNGARVSFGGEYILGENSAAAVSKIDGELMDIQLISGDMLVCLGENDIPAQISTENAIITCDRGIFSISAQTGTITVSVFSDEVTVSTGEQNEKILSGAFLCIMAEETYSGDISISSLNGFYLSFLSKLSESKELCFTKVEFEALAAERQSEIQELQNGSGNIVYLDANASGEKDNGIAQQNENAYIQDYTQTDVTYTESGDALNETESGGTAENSTVQGNKTDHGISDNDGKGNTTEAENGKKPQTAVAEGGKKPQEESAGGGKKPQTVTEESKVTESPSTTEEAEPKVMTCTVQIRCDTILNNLEDLKPGKEAYVPESGIILGTATVEFTEGETAFDVLKRVCSYYGLQIEYSYTPLYGSYYIEGINYLYEFDCGSQSGWMYKVNGWFPNYGCSSYVMADGDTMVWCYTCKGLGEDVGGSVY